MSVRYIVHHNGLTCFVPPCFCWTARSNDGHEVTFSEIDVSLDDDLPALVLRQWIAAPADRSLDAEGDVETYEVPPPNNATQGLRFVIRRAYGFV